MGYTERVDGMLADAVEAGGRDRVLRVPVAYYEAIVRRCAVHRCPDALAGPAAEVTGLRYCGVRIEWDRDCVAPEWR